MGNQISGQAMDILYFGVTIETTVGPESVDNQVIGNLIGTNAAGTSAIPNGGGVGVAYLVKGTIIRDNVISGNSLRGILLLETTENEVRDNNIGVAVDGVSPLPNTGVGIILVTAPDNIIGTGNTIAYNQFGVAIGYPASVGNTITQNSIYGNTDEQIGFFDVPSPLAPAPNLTGWDGTTVSGSACAGCQVEVFANWSPVPAGHTYLGTTTAAGGGSFSLSVGPGYRYLAATATDGDGTTSEFSNILLVDTDVYLYLPLAAKNAGL
jgi:parallel beta-helix repeat protein